MKIEEIFYTIPIDKEVIKQIPSLEKFNYTNCYCKATPLNYLSSLGNLFLISIYDFFSTNKDEIISIELLKKQELLYGRVLCEKISSRGKDKFIKLGGASSDIELTDMPYLRYNSSISNSLNGNWFYIKPAEYYIFSAIESKFENVRHLETLSIYVESIIRLRIVIELLKKNISNNLISLSKSDLIKIGCSYLRPESLFKSIDDETLLSGVENWIDEMLLPPVFGEIPLNNREIPIGI